MITIRKYTEADKKRIWEIIKFVLSAADSFTLSPDSTREEMLADWCSAEKQTYVAVSENKIVATFYIKANQPGLGSHIPNGSYMVAPEARGKGIGRKIGEFSIEEAKRLGYYAMQFNFVVKSNEKAVKLWQSLGFEIIGEIPDGFNQIENGLTNAYIIDLLQK